MSAPRATAELPAAALADLDLVPARVNHVRLLQNRDGRLLYRLRVDGVACVLKHASGGEAPSHEVRAYTLLRELGVPTLPLCDLGQRTLLLEDLDASDTWRCAVEEDISRREVGLALAEWYRALHGAGSRWLAERSVPAWLHYEDETLTPERILALGRRVGAAHQPVWAEAAEALDPLRGGLRSLPPTLTYNDCHWTNLALSRAEDSLRAVIYDYHLLGVGVRASDWRNVRSALRCAAAVAFAAADEPPRRREALLDAPLALLSALWEASQRPRWPSWANPLLQQALDGTLLQDILRALDALF